MDDNNTSDINLQSNLAKLAHNYLEKVGNIIEISKEINNVVADNIFNIKLSLSILKGGIKDFQKGTISVEGIKGEVKEIKDNLVDPLRVVKKAQSKINQVENLSDIANLSEFSKNISEKHKKNIENFKMIVSNFIINLKEKVLDVENNLLAQLEKENLKTMDYEFLDKWYSNFFSVNNMGFNIINTNRNTTKKLEQHIKDYKDNINNEMKVREVIEEIKTGKIYGNVGESIEVKNLTPGSLTKDLYDIKGDKIKSAYENITAEDIKNFKKNKIQMLYFRNPKVDELKPNNYRIVAIDDSKANTDLITALLSEQGFKVSSYNEPAKALNIIREDFPDLVILDIKMPGMDGFTFLEQLKSVQENNISKLNKLPVIMLTAFSGESYVRRALNLGAIDYHSKPINKDLFIKKVMVALQLISKKDELQESDKVKKRRNRRLKKEE